MIRVGRERLKRYRWSSYPWYLIGGRRPEWLSTAQVLASLRLGPEERRGYEAYVEGRALELGTQAGRKEMETQWKALRRGWYVGGEGFLEKLEGYLEDAVHGRQRESHSGQAKAAHGEAAAEKALRDALSVLKLSGGELEQLPKSAPEKAVLAWWLRQRTTVPLRWVSERLAMGHVSRVSQAVGQIRRQPARKHEQLKRLLAAGQPTPP